MAPVGKVSVLLLVIATFSLGIFSGLLVHAQTPCGNIITPTNTTEITDCTNPFGATSVASPFTLKIKGEVVTSKTEVLIASTGTTDYTITGNVYDAAHNFYRHDGDDYVLVETTTPNPEEADFRYLANSFFRSEVDSEPYIQYLLGNPAGTNENTWDWDILNDFNYSNSSLGEP